MEIMKKVMAIVLVLVLSLSLVVVASAASSPTEGYEDFDPETMVDSNTKDHTNKTVETKVSSLNKAVMFKIESKAGAKRAYLVQVKNARNVNGQAVPITQIGNGKAGVLNNKKGNVVTKMRVDSTAKNVTIAANAFKNSYIKLLKLNSKTVTIKANAFKGTKVKNPKIYISGTKKDAKDLKFAEGAFNGLNSKAKVIVSKGIMTKAQFAKLDRKLTKAKFPGKVIWKG